MNPQAPTTQPVNREQRPSLIHRARPALYAQPDILSRGNFSKTHHYNLMARDQFPKPCLVMGKRFTRWSAVDVDDWFADPVAWIAAHSKVAKQLDSQQEAT